MPLKISVFNLLSGLFRCLAFVELFSLSLTSSQINLAHWVNRWNIPSLFLYFLPSFLSSLRPNISTHSVLSFILSFLFLIHSSLYSHTINALAQYITIITSAVLHYFCIFLHFQCNTFFVHFRIFTSNKKKNKMFLHIFRFSNISSPSICLNVPLTLSSDFPPSCCMQHLSV